VKHRSSEDGRERRGRERLTGADSTRSAGVQWMAE